MYPKKSSTSFWDESSVLAQCRRLLAEESLGLSAIAPVFVMPYVEKFVRMRQRLVRVRLRYGTLATIITTGRKLYIRSHSADFNIVPPEWLHRGLSSVYSIGPGLTDQNNERVGTVLLLQSFSLDEQTDGIAGELRRLAGAILESRVPEYDLPCFRLSAILGMTAETG
jgi:hypothetical protein